MKPKTYLVGGPAHGDTIALDNNSLAVEYFVDRPGSTRNLYRRRRYFRTRNGEQYGEPYVIFEHADGATYEQVAETLDRIDRDPKIEKAETE